MEQIQHKLGWQLAQLMKQHRAIAEQRLSAIGLHVGQETILLQLCREDGLCQHALASCMNVEPPTITKMLQRMQRQGLVERRKDSKDARMTRVYITDKGRALEAAIVAIWDDLERHMLCSLSDVEQALMRRILAQMQHNLN